MKSVKPTLESIEALAEFVREYYAEGHQEWDRDEIYLDMKYPVDLPRDIKPIYPPTPLISLDTAREHVPTDNPRVFVPKANDKTSGQKHKEKLRRFYTGWINRNVTEAQYSPLDRCVQHLFQMNMAVLKTLYIPLKDVAEDEETAELQKRNHLPIVLQAVNPRNFYPDPSEFPEYGIEIYERSAAELAYKYPNWKRPKNADGSYKTKVRWVEYWDKNYRCYLADGEPVLKTKVEKHGYGVLCYNWTFASFGRDTAEGNFTKKTQGILRPLRAMFEEEAYLWSVNHEINKVIAWPTTYIIGGSGQGGSLEKKPGKLVWLKEGTQIKTDEPGKLAEGVLAELQMVRNEIFDKTAPRSVRGLPEAGVRSGYDRSLLVMEARLRYGSVGIALGKIMAQTLGNAARLLETLVKDGITVWGREPERGEFEETIKGSDVKGHYICYVEFAPAEVEDEYRKANTGAMLMERGVIGRTRTQEKYAGIMDPEEETVEIWADRMEEGLAPAAMQLAQGKFAKEVMAREVKEGASLANTPTPGEMGGAGGGTARATAGSQTGAPFVAEQNKPFSSGEEQQVIASELKGLEKK